MNKTTSETAAVDQYIDSFPKNVQERLAELRKFISDLVPDAIEVISYKMPSFRLNDRQLIYYSAFKNHIGMYPFPSGVFDKEAKDYKTSGRGTIQFQHDQPIPFPLVKKLVEYRIKEVQKAGNGY